MKRPAAPPPFLATRPSDVFYLTGLQLDGFWLLLLGATRVVFTPIMLAGQLRELLPDTEIIADNDMPAALGRYCRARGLGRIAADFVTLPHATARRIADHCTLEDAGTFMADRRRIKNAVELEHIRHACVIAREVFEQVRPRIRPGMTELQIAYKIEALFARRQVRPSFTTIVAFGSNTANPHHVSSGRKLAADDVVLIDMGCLYQGYASDLTRTFSIGRIKYLYKRIHAIVARAHRDAIAGVCPGTPANQVDGIARRVITRAGYGEYFIHTTGHGVGVEVHEPPRLGPRDTTVLKAGMVVTVEPGIYVPGQCGVRIEDTIEVTPTGRKVLTR